MSLKNQSATENNDAFKIKIEDLIKEILIDNGMPYYRIESKMEFTGAQEESNYRPVIRIITYFEDTVNKISDLLQTEFDLTNMRSLNKGARVETFSYKHVQYIAGLKQARQALTEYKRSADKKFEIQVCSMIQDAWVGIEKELGYDSATVPEDVKRDFYRVGALLEMADLEFLKIRSQIRNATANNAAANGAEQATTFAAHLQAVASEAPAAQVQPEATETTKETVTEPAHTHIAVPIAATVAAAAAAIPLAEQLRKTVAETQSNAAESVESNVDKFSSMAASVHEAAKSNTTEDALADLINIGATNERLAITPEEEHSVAAPVAPITQEATTEPRSSAAQNAGNVNVPTYSANVNAATQTAAEAIREQAIPAAPAKPVPFYNEAPKAPALETVDEHSPMTDASLRDYVQNSRALKEVDMQIAERAGAKLNTEIDIEGDVDRLKFLKVNTLKQLHERILDNSADIVAFAEKWIGKDNGGSFDSGICLFYLEYLLVGKKNDPAFAVEYVVKFISDNDYSARYIIPTYNSIRNAEPTTSHAHLTLK